MILASTAYFCIAAAFCHLLNRPQRCALTQYLIRIVASLLTSIARRREHSILLPRVCKGVTAMKMSSALGLAATAALLCAAPLSLHWSPAKTLSLSIDAADARVGRPLTPMSVAGVNRRVHRRAYYGAAAVGAYGYARRC